MSRSILLTLFTSLCINSVHSQTKGSWGDQGNGTYINPILNADYSDPDIERVGDKYYMVCSEFHYMGMPVLESEDMVNWKIIAQIHSKLDFPVYENMAAYGTGTWAPCIRYHAGKLWVYVCTPNEGLFMSTAEKPEGPWSPLLHVKNIKGWEDPCPFWDEDGKAYLGHSVYGAGPIIIHQMSEDGTKLLDDGKTVYTGPVAEGTKIFKRDGYYYMSIPEGGVPTGWQTILRSKNIYGPFEKKVVLEKGSTSINGPHQGALVDTPEGEWWFYHFQSAGSLGRVVHLQPVFWHDGWPVVGVDIDRNGIGEPVFVWKKPATGKNVAVHAPQTDDDFETPRLGLQWQFNHNPDNSAWSLTDKSGYLSLKALEAKNFTKAKNTVTQKTMGNTGEVTVALDLSGMAEGQKAGLSAFSSEYSLIGVYRTGGKNFVFYENQRQEIEKQAFNAKVIYLKIKLDCVTNQNKCYYSTDNKTFTSFGKEFKTVFGHWKGARIGLFSYNEQKDSGVALFNWFKYDYDGPK